MSDHSVFVVISQESRVIKANDAFCNLIDHPKHIVEKKMLLDLIHPEDHTTAVNAFIDVFYGVHKPKTYNFRLISAKGNTIQTLAIITPDRSQSALTASIELSIAS